MAIFTPARSLGAVQDFASRLAGDSGDYDPLLDIIGGARFVLLGEATHGTREFYRARAEITKRLVEEKGFTIIAWEADWPDALRVNRYVRGLGGHTTAEQALRGFQRFPTWMWRNTDVVQFVEWLRKHNAKVSDPRTQAGIYGLDLYSLHSSMEAVIAYLQKVDPEGARAARERYSCFEHFGDDPQAYGMTASQHSSLSCEDEVVRQLAELQKHASDYLSRDGRMASDELFFAEQNARVAKNAELYYRAMYRGRPNTWNLRDTHMVDTLDQLVEHLEGQGEHPKAILWAHNSHLGDARATQMGSRGELNVGQLVRQRHGVESVLVGFTTYTGEVTAAADWGAVAERKRIRPAMAESFERLFHETGVPNFVLPICQKCELIEQLKPSQLERAIGVIYRPDTERLSHYFYASLSKQFDAIIHCDETHAVEPLERTPHWDKGELPETYPSGL